MAKRIALAGRPLAGKTTLAKLLKERYGYHHASMSNVIIAELVNRLNARSEYQYSGEDIYHDKEIWRQDLQVIGDDLGFQDPERIISVMRKVLMLSGALDHPEDPVVLEAIRGDMQASAARALGFVVVELWVDSETQFIRSATRYGPLGEEGYHTLRQSMEDRPDIESGIKSASIRITPELSLENQAHLLHLLPEGGLSHGPADQPFKPGSLADWGRQR